MRGRGRDRSLIVAARQQREVTTQRHNAKNRSIWSRFGYDAESHREVTTRRTALSKVTLKSRTRRWGRPPGLRPASTPASPLHPTRSRTRRSGADLEIRPTSAAATFISMGGQEGHCDSQPSRLGNAAVAGFTGDSRYRSAYRLAAARSRRSSGAVRRGP